MNFNSRYRIFNSLSGRYLCDCFDNYLVFSSKINAQNYIRLRHLDKYKFVAIGGF